MTGLDLSIPTQTSNDPVRTLRARYDQVLSLHLAHYKAEDIAEIVNLTTTQVYHILRDPRMQKAIRTARERILSGVLTEISERMTSLGSKALDNIEDTINAEIVDEDGNPMIGSRAKRHQDHVSFELLSRIGFHRPEGDGGKARGGLQLSPEGEKRLIQAVEKANRAAEMYPEETVIENPEIEGEPVDSGAGTQS